MTLVAGGHAKPGIFNTHRARKVRKVSVALVAVLFGLTLFNGAINGDAEEPADPELTDYEVAADELSIPEVAPPRSNPFVEQSSALEVATAEGEGTEEQGAIYQGMLSAAADAALGFGVYSWEQSPEEYVDSIPATTGATREALLASAEESWPALEAEEIVSVAEVRGQPQLVAFDEEQGLAQVAVMARQNITDRDGESEFTRSFTVYLEQDEASEEPAWEVVGLVRG